MNNYTLTNTEMKIIDPARTDLAWEFRANPFGPHSAELQQVLSIMRWKENHGKYVLVETGTRNRWVLGRLPKRRGLRVEIFENLVFADYAEGLWHLFRLRWEEHTDRTLEEE